MKEINCLGNFKNCLGKFLSPDPTTRRFCKNCLTKKNALERSLPRIHRSINIYKGEKFLSD